jgi:2-amino-4-hydroxy-6-hydroxymethyldihydropteridine diphosphokinase
MNTLVLIGLGSNLGDRKAHLDHAVASLSRTPDLTVRAVSSYRETAPVGGPAGQGTFLNAAAAVETTLEAEALLDRLHAIEDDAGRVRGPRWGERTLDLDLLLFGERVIQTPRLRVPHPRMALRRFVLAPLAEVAPEAVDPITGRNVRDLLANLDRRPSCVAIASPPSAEWDIVRDSLGERDPLTPPDMSRFSGGDSARLCERLHKALPARSVNEAISGDDQTWLVSPVWFDSFFLAVRPHRRGLFDSHWEGEAPAEPRESRGDQESSAGASPPQIVSRQANETAPFLDPSGPRFSQYREAFLAERSNVLPATFVVARPEDRKRLGIHDPLFALHRPIGWDTPILEVDDFDSDATLAEVVATCAGTRTG